MFRFNLLAFTCLVQLVAGHLSSSEKSSNHPHESSAFPLNPRNIGSFRQRSLVAGTSSQKELQRLWWNWNLCTNAYPNASFTSVNTFAPPNTIFLAGYPTVNLDNSSLTCKTKTITRNGTISTGNQTIFYPVYNFAYIDYSDDWKLFLCGNTSDEVLMGRLNGAEALNMQFTNTSYTQFLYSDIDGAAVQPVYIYDTDEYYTKACSDNRTSQEYFTLLGFPEGDTCDAEPFQAIGGLDVFPLLGWYGIDTRNWVDGETHTYEFGYLLRCVTAKYIITAKAPPSDPPCGLFGLGLFCPIEWLKWFFSLFS